MSGFRPIVGILERQGTACHLAAAAHEAAIGVRALEDLRELKAACRGRIAMFGNLDGIETRRWDGA